MNTLIVKDECYLCYASEALRFFGKDAKWVAQGRFSRTGYRYIIESLDGRFYEVFWFSHEEIGGPSWQIGETPKHIQVEELSRRDAIGFIEPDLIAM